MKINELNVTLSPEQIRALYVFLSHTNYDTRNSAVEDGGGVWYEELDDVLMSFWFSIDSLRDAR